jgi:hypothetical protein
MEMCRDPEKRLRYPGQTLSGCLESAENPDVRQNVPYGCQKRDSGDRADASHNFFVRIDIPSAAGHCNPAHIFFTAPFSWAASSIFD